MIYKTIFHNIIVRFLLTITATPLLVSVHHSQGLHMTWNTYIPAEGGSWTQPIASKSHKMHHPSCLKDTHEEADIYGIDEQAKILFVTIDGHASLQHPVWQACWTKLNLRRGLVYTKFGRQWAVASVVIVAYNTSSLDFEDTCSLDGRPEGREVLSLCQCVRV